MSKQPWYYRVPVVSNIAGAIKGDPAHAFDPSSVGLLQDTTDAMKKPYDKAAEADRAAGAELAKVGADAQAQEQAGIGRALDQTTPAARYWHGTYEDGGGLAGPGNLEKRYGEVKSGMDPAFQYAMDEGNRSIDNSFSAKGLNNSGASERARALMSAKVIADREGRLDTLAAGSQGAAETRMGGAFDRVNNLGQSRAGIVQQGTEAGVNSMVAGRTGQLNANLNASQQGINAQKDILGTVTQVGGALLGAAAGAPPPPPGGGYGAALAPRRRAPYDPDAPMAPTRF